MISEKKRLANKLNAQQSTGPRTVLGKRNSSRNSLKHGLFSRELRLKDKDKPIFSALQAELAEQLTPDTALQRIAFDAVVLCSWRCRSASCLEAERLQKLNSPESELSDPVDGPKPDPELLHWFGAGRRELNTGVRMLQQLRVDIDRVGNVRDSWKDSLTACFGTQLYSALREWAPINPAALQMANSLVAHAENFKMPLPEEKSRTIYVQDPAQGKQMALKLVDVYISALLAARRMADEGTLANESAPGLNLNFTRYFPEAMRNLENAVEWLLRLKAEGL